MGSRSRRLRVVTVLGTRPEIIKCSPLLPRFDEEFEHLLIHTGQHYDAAMDRVFFDDLGLRLPDAQLGVGSGPHSAQLARMLMGIEPLLTTFQPDLMVVQGDTNSTLAGALAAVKLGIPIAHLEAGCRSFNRNMPEEINRVIVDRIATLLLSPDETASINLRREGIAGNAIFTVGSTGIDACLRASRLPLADDFIASLGITPGSYLLATIHRAENTTPARLRDLMAALETLSQSWPVLFPVHPRTAGVLDQVGRPDGIRYLEPAGYPQMIQMLRQCRALLTDSGGLQEEGAVLGTPTFILRTETEWSDFVAAGHHLLVGTDPHAIVDTVRRTLVGGQQEQRMRQPIGLDRAGAAERVVLALRGFATSKWGEIGPWMPPERILNSTLELDLGGGRSVEPVTAAVHIQGA